MKRRRWAILLIAALLTWLPPLSATALVDPNPDNGQSVMVKYEETLNENLGVVSVNSGVVNKNAGRIGVNYRTVHNNTNTVEANAVGALLGHNAGKGVVMINDGTMYINDATIQTNMKGKVLSNNGVVENNWHGIIQGNGRKGTVKVNQRLIEVNHGTVNKNAKSGTVEENNGHVLVNAGMVEKNAGTVERNTGTVENNGGVVHNYGGRVLGGAGEVIEHNEVKVSGLSGVAGVSGLTEFDDDGDGELDSLWFDDGPGPQSAEIRLRPGYTMDWADGDGTLTHLGNGVYRLMNVDDDVALTVTPPEAPRTGDGAAVGAWAMTMAAGLSGVAWARGTRTGKRKGR